MTPETPPADGPDATGERLMPELQRGELVHAEHLARYRVAAQLAKGRRVLDAACGEGYGTAILAAAGASSAVGVDVDGATVAHARRRYGLEFAQADVAALPFAEDSFDLVVSFETIEHVSEPEAVLDEFSRVLAPEGLLVISTPNRHEYLVENEFHTREFTHEEFLALLRPRFPGVRILYQQNWLTSTILEEGQLREESGERPIDLEFCKLAGVQPGRELYTVAVCGGRTDAALDQVAVAAEVFEAHELAARLADAVRTQHHWHEQSVHWQGQSVHWQGQSVHWQRQADHLARDIAAMEDSWSWRLTRPLRAAAALGRRWRAR